MSVVSAGVQFVPRCCGRDAQMCCAHRCTHVRDQEVMKCFQECVTLEMGLKGGVCQVEAWLGEKTCMRAFQITA